MKGSAQEWLRLDRDKSTRSEIQAFLDKGDVKSLEDRLCKRLSFGTAGLRAAMGAGFSRINSLTIIQTSQGLAAWLLSTHGNAKKAGVVVGYDGRHNSKHFAELAAAAFVSKEMQVWWYEDVVHTPLVPFAVKHLKAAAGVMVTASHNPAQDNGYKVYEASGCQVNTPADEEIAAHILENLEPLTWDTESLKTSSLVRSVRDPMTNLYMGNVWDYVKRDSIPSSHIFPPFVYTPLHGVGLSFMQQAVQALSCPVAGPEGKPLRLTLVQEQAFPDPHFSTVKYPNPEEAGALDRAKSTADKHGVTLIIANDPDADRFVAAEKVDGEWRQFTGDQIGVLLASYVLGQRTSPPASNGERSPGQKQYLLASAVSSQMLSHIASDAKVCFEETLTGFKWLGTRALAIENAGNKCLFAYEEALGYMIPSLVYDKDGILAAAVFLSACPQWGSPWAELQKLYERHGYFVTMNTYWRLPDIGTATKLFEKIRALGEPYPAEVAGRKVLRWRDLTTAFDSSAEDHRPTLPCSASSQMITCWLGGSQDDGVRLTVRGSGTEPKVKVYLECKADRQSRAEIGAEAALRCIGREWFDDPRVEIESKYRNLIN